MALHQPMTDHDNEPTEIREIQIIPLRWVNGSTVLHMTDALDAAGLTAGGSLHFAPSAVDDHGLLLAFGSSSPVDGRREPLGSSIQAKSNTLSVAIPSDGLRALGIDPDGIDWDQPPKVTVWAGEQLIALERPSQRRISVDRSASEH